MRSFLSGALLLLGAVPLAAQQDSTARRDSILERERRRIGGEAVSREAPYDDRSTTARHRGFAAAIGAVGPASWLEIPAENGVTMRTSVGVRAGVEASWPQLQRGDLVLAARLGLAKPEAKNRALAGSPGSVSTVDLLGGIDWLLSNRWRIRTAIGGTWIHGPSDIDPWASDTEIAPAADISAAVRLTRSQSWWLAAGVGALHYSGIASSAPISGNPGSVVRPWLEVRHAF